MIRIQHQFQPIHELSIKRLNALFICELVKLPWHNVMLNGIGWFQAAREKDNALPAAMKAVDSSLVQGIEISLYLFTIGLINFGLGAITTLAMALLGMPAPRLWGTLACLLNFISYLGAAVTCTVIAAVSLLTFNSWLHIALPPAIFFIFTALEGQFVTPMILGRLFMIDPVLLFLTILVFGWLWGIPGAFLAVPLLTTIRIVVWDVDGLKKLRPLFD